MGGSFCCKVEQLHDHLMSEVRRIDAEYRQGALGRLVFHFGRIQLLNNFKQHLSVQYLPGMSGQLWRVFFCGIPHVHVWIRLVDEFMKANGK